MNEDWLSPDRLADMSQQAKETAAVAGTSPSYQRALWRLADAADHLWMRTVRNQLPASD